MTDSVTVEQCDRDAAEYYGAAVGYPDNDPTGDCLRTAFARHRIAERERAEQICSDRAEVAFLKPRPDDWTEPMWNVRQLAIHSALHCAANAIREPKP